MDPHHHFAVGHVGLERINLALDCDIITPQLFRSVRLSGRRGFRRRVNASK
jgi:hypothetical protein